MALSIQSLQSESLIAAQKIVNAQSSEFPLEERFPRRSYSGKTLEIRVKNVAVKQGKYTDLDGAAYLTRPGQLTKIRVTPLATRPMGRFSNEDLTLFRAWDQVLMDGGGEQGTAVTIAAGDRLAEFVEETSLEGREAMHAMKVGALLGTFTYEIDGVEVEVDYGHNDLSSIITTNWSDTAALIVTNMYQLVDAYIAASGGVRPTTCYYSSRAFAAYFIKNVEFKGYVAAVPGLAQAFAGVRNGLEVVDADLRFIDPFWRMEWIPIDGTHVLQSGSSAARWPVNSFTLTSEGIDTKRLLEHSMSKDEYNPNNTWTWETFRQDEPKGMFARYSDQGAANILIPERVQIFDAIPN